uniref:Uncharacterized protein n=1 Tax=Solanum tuberosum TaxID=4113 RepID=M1DJS5_SOLTU
MNSILQFTKTLSKLEKKIPKSIILLWKLKLIFNCLKINNKFGIYRLQKIVLADLSVRLVGIADQLSDSPFGVVRRRLALAFNIVLFCSVSLGDIVLLRQTIRRSADCSFHRLFDPAPLGLRVLEQRADFVPSVIRQVCLAMLRL